jgi:ectoine hydroxylase
MLVQDDLYPTRGDEEFLCERKDPVIYGQDGDGCRRHLSDSEMSSYEKNGFVIVPNVFSKHEIASLNSDLAHLRRSKGREKKRHLRTDIPAGESESLFAPDKTSAVFHDLAREPRVLDRVHQILGTPAYLHRARIHVDAGANGTAYPWHSEFETWHAEDGVPRMHGVEAWLMLSPSNPMNGALQMLAKSHYIYAACRAQKRALGAPLPNDKDRTAAIPARPSPETLTRLLYFGALARAYGEPGTLVLCDSNLMYASAKGSNGNRRMTAMFSYNSMENLPIGQPFAGDTLRPSPVVNEDRTQLEARQCDLIHARATRSTRARENSPRRVSSKRESVLV